MRAGQRDVRWMSETNNAAPKTRPPVRDEQRVQGRPHERGGEPSPATPVPGECAGSPVLGLQRSAGNQAVTSLLSPRASFGRRADLMAQHVPSAPEPQDPESERKADVVAERLLNSWESSASTPPPEDRTGDEGNGSPHARDRLLPSQLRAGAERVLGLELDDVRLHDDDRAHDTTEAHDARALTFGRNIYFSRGELATDSRAGRVLLGHELAHVAQQASSGQLRAQAQPKTPAKKPKRVVRATLYVDLHTVVYELEDDTTKSGTATFDGLPAAGTYIARKENGKWNAYAETGTENLIDRHLAYDIPQGVTLEGVTSFSFRVITGTPNTTSGVSQIGGKMPDVRASTPDSSLKVQSTTKGGGTTPGDQPAPKPLTEEEKKVFEDLVEKMTGATQSGDTPLTEQLRLFEILRDRVDEMQFSEAGASPWTKFAKFLDVNREKIEGILRGKPPGELTQDKIGQIIAEYGKFIAAEPLEPAAPETAGGLEKVEDFDKEFKYDPGWQKLSKQDRQLLVEMAKLDPDNVSQAPIDFTKITTSMKVTMALKLSWGSWPGETAAAAKAAFTDPSFIISLIVMMGIYVGLWLTPDPTWVTKVAAGTLTAVLLAQFALEDIIGFAMAWSNMTDACAVATTVPQLQAAGDRFAKKVGQVGFDIILMIVMHRIGKAVGPKVQKIGIERNIARAQAEVTAAESRPGSGATKMATPETAKLLDTAKAKAKGTTPTAVLDALADLLPESARKGLAAFRAKAGDMAVWRSMEARTKASVDLAQLLTEQGMTEAALKQAKADLVTAEAKLARAQLIEAETLKDPALRIAKLLELTNKLKARLVELGIFDDPKVKQAAAGGDLTNIVSVLAEAIQRTVLAAENAGLPKGRILSNLAVARRVAGFKTIAEWKAAEIAAGREGRTAKLIEYQGEIFELLGEADAVVMQETTPGQFKPVAIEEVKAGSADQPTKAMAQVTKIIAALSEMAGGTTELRAFEITKQQAVANDWTYKLDLSAVESIAKSTRGPAGKGFTKSLPYDSEVLLEVAKSIVKNGLPPRNPPPTLPVLPMPNEEEKRKKQKDRSLH